MVAPKAPSFFYGQYCDWDDTKNSGDRGTMNSRLQAEVRRRQNLTVQFYHSAIGNKLKKRRTELRMTQQTLAKGIISNTFVSKLENNVIHANKECLMMLMERLDLPLDTVNLPENLLNMLHRSVDCYYWMDRQGYRDVIDQTRSDDFSVLVQIIRLGYACLIRNTEEAIPLFNDLCRYFPSMDDQAFSVFMVYGAEAHLLTGDYPMVRECLNSAEQIVGTDRRLVAMIHHHYCLLYGFTEEWGSAFREGAEARRNFEETGNLRRLMKMNVDRFQFRLADQTDWTIPYSPDQLSLLDAYDVDRYHFLRAVLESEHEDLFDKIEYNSQWYPVCLFLRCWKAQSEGNQGRFTELMTQWERLESSAEWLIDYRHLLELSAKGDLTGLKDYLVDVVLPLAIQKNNLFLMKRVTDEIFRILTKKKRYKDACIYAEKLVKETERIKRKWN